MQTSSNFLQRIQEKLFSIAAQNSSLRLHVSVAEQPVWEATDSGDEVLVRWACWSIDRDGEEVSPPEFEVLSQQVTREQLAIEIPAYFPDITVIVDDDIET